MLGLEGHTLNVVGECLVAYGGKKAATVLNGDVFVMSLNTSVWQRLAVAREGPPPMPRAYHSACVDNWNLVVFGGITGVGVDDIHYNAYNVFTGSDALDPAVLQLPGKYRFRDEKSLQQVTQRRREAPCVHILSLEGEAAWETIPTTGSNPPQLSHHAATIYQKDYMFVVGGYDVHADVAQRYPQSQPPLGGPSPTAPSAAGANLYCLNLRSGCWQSFQLPTSLLCRWGMAHYMMGEPLWFLNGGVSRNASQEVNTTIVLHLDTLSVESVANTSIDNHHGLTPPVLPPRAMHSAFRYGDSIYVFGGASDVTTTLSRRMYRFDTITAHWSVVEQTGDLPPAPVGSTAVIVAGKAVLFGGVSARYVRSNEMYVFDIATCSWSRVDTVFSHSPATNVRGVRQSSSSTTSSRISDGRRMAPAVDGESAITRGIQTDPPALHDIPGLLDALVMPGAQTSEGIRQPTKGASASAGDSLLEDIVSSGGGPVPARSTAARGSGTANWERELKILHSEVRDWRQMAVKEGEAMLRPLAFSVPAERSVPTYRIDHRIPGLRQSADPSSGRKLKMQGS